jgi:hypothetical protein
MCIVYYFFYINIINRAFQFESDSNKELKNPHIKVVHSIYVLSPFYIYTFDVIYNKYKIHKFLLQEKLKSTCIK